MASLARSLVVLGAVAFVSAQQGTVKYIFENAYVTAAGKDLIKNNAMAKYDFDEGVVPAKLYSDGGEENDLHYQHCVAGCANKHYFGTHCNAVFVEDPTDNVGPAAGNVCYHANLNLPDLLAFKEEEDETKWGPAVGTNPTQYKVKYLNIFDALHNV